MPEVEPYVTQGSNIQALGSMQKYLRKPGMEPNWGWAGSRLGRYSPQQTKHRPLRVTFDDHDQKHSFLKNAKLLRQTGVRFDDDLTKLQQKERQALSADFSTLKENGQIFFFRGSTLRYAHADKVYTCRSGQANKAPIANKRSVDFDIASDQWLMYLTHTTL